MAKKIGLAFVMVLLVLASPSAKAGTSDGTVDSEQKISDTAGGFGGVLDNGDAFSRQAVASLGDLDGDGITDLAVGAAFDDDGGTNRGAVWILFLDTDGTVQAEQKISDTAGGFGGVLDNGDEFGISVANLGDLDGDGITDLAVGASNGDDGGTDRGAVWILFLDTDGTVQAEQKISDTAGGFGGVLDNVDRFGTSVSNLGDLDGDNIIDLAVGALNDDDGGDRRGAVWILFLDTDGTVQAEQKISDTAGGFGGVLDNVDIFGISVASLGDLDGDNITDLAVGARNDDDGGTDRGAVWILFLDTDGTVQAEQKISDTAGGFGGTLDNFDAIGFSVANLGDLDGDNITDLAVGSTVDDDGGFNRGAVWILFLDTDGTVKAEQKISDTAGNFGGVLDNQDSFGCSLTSLGDLDGDNVTDLAVGACTDDDGGTDRGAVWILFLTSLELDASVDIKSGSCPNSFNRKSKGVLPVSVVSSDSFDALAIDITTVLLSRADGVGGSVAPLEGPPGPHSVFEDTATPFDGELCDCHELEGDLIPDLSMKFDTSTVVEELQLNDLPAGELVELVVTGELLDGTPFAGRDCIALVPGGGGIGSNAIASEGTIPSGGRMSLGSGITNEEPQPETTGEKVSAPEEEHDQVRRKKRALRRGASRRDQ